MKDLFKSFLCEEEGATAVEYALIVGLIALVSFTSFKLLGVQVQRIIGWMYIKMYGIHAR